jgi:phosphatidate cytidylyltransferase
MLKQRVLTALILIPVLVAALFYFPPGWVVVLFGVFIAAAAWEWTLLSGMRSIFSRATYVFCLLLLGGAAIYSVFQQPSPIGTFLAAAGLWWLWALAELISRKDVNKGMFATTSGRVVGGFLVLIPPWVASIYLLAVDNEHPRLLLLFLLVLVWVADTVAYLAGSFFGRTKLAPHVSPGKTVEGVMGGVAAVVLLAWLCGTMIWKLEPGLLARWIGLAVVTALFSVVGDLTESKLKRIAGAKDSGSLIPGHGGVLDRIDALTAATPVFLLGVITLFKF